MTAHSRRTDALVTWLLRHSPIACRVIAIVAALTVTLPFFYHMWRGSIAYLGLLEDDYFYYALIADKLATLGKLTYDGVTTTNGFHPAWFLTVFALRLLAGGLNGAFYVLLCLAFFTACIATYELLRALARSLGASPAIAAALPLLYAVANDLVVSSGMETALDVPLLVWLVLELSKTTRVTPRRAAWLGFVSSLAILSRLDIALFVLIFTLGWLALSRPPLAELGRTALAFCVSGIAIPIYAVANWVLCQSVLPVSAVAKQLVARPGINIRYLFYMAFYTAYGRTPGILLVLGTIAVFVLWRRQVHRSELVKPEVLFAAASVIGFAGLIFSMNTLSGWGYFGWYAYPYGASLLAAMVLVGTLVAARLSEQERARASALVVAVACVLPIAEGVRSFADRGPRWSVGDNGLLAMSVDLSRHMKGYNGVLAMGAMSGFASNMTQRPFVQLEGLVADRAMVEHIRREDDLGEVLREYHVDYLVVSLHDATMKPHDGCYTVTQPNAEWSGSRVHRMAVDVCGEPVTHFQTDAPEHSWSKISRLDTYVFDLRNATFRKTARAGGGPSFGTAVR
jgi:hypothetical protein